MSPQEPFELAGDAASGDGSQALTSEQPQKETEAKAQAGTGLFIVGACLLPLPAILFVGLILVMTTALYRYFVNHFALRRRILFSTYIDEGSFLQRYAQPSPFQKARAACYAVFFALITVTTLFSYSAGKLGVLLVGMTVGAVVAESFAEKWVGHAKEVFRPYFRSMWINRGALIGAALLSAGWELATTRGNYQDWDATLTADTVIKEVKHPVKIVQHVARTVSYINYTILRMRDNMGGFGGIAYLFFIVPNLLPIAGIVGTFSATGGLARRVHTP